MRLQGDVKSGVLHSGMPASKTPGFPLQKSSSMANLSNEAVCATIDHRQAARGDNSSLRKEQVSSARKTEKSRASACPEPRAASRTGIHRIGEPDRKSRSRVVMGTNQLQTSASSSGVAPSPFTRPRGSRATPPIPTLVDGHSSHLTGGSPDLRGLRGRDERRSTRASSRSWARDKPEEEGKRHLPYGPLNTFGGSVTTQQMSAYYAQQANFVKNATDTTTVSLRRLSKGQQVVSSPGIRGFDDKEAQASEVHKSVNLSEDQGSNDDEEEESESNSESSEVKIQHKERYISNTLMNLEPSKVTNPSVKELTAKCITTVKISKAMMDPTQMVYPPSPIKPATTTKQAATKKSNAVTSSGARPLKQRLEDLRSSNSSKIGLNKQPGETTVEDLLHMRSFSKHGTARATATAPSKALLPKPSLREEKPQVQVKLSASNLNGMSGSAGAIHNLNTPTEPSSHTSSKRGKSPPKKQGTADDYYPAPRAAPSKVQPSINSKLKDLPSNVGANGAVSGEYLTSYIRSRVERMGEGTSLQRELIANKNNSRLDALERKKMCLMQSTKKSGLVTHALVNPQFSHDFAKPSTSTTTGTAHTLTTTTNGAMTVSSTASSSTNQHNPAPKATSPPPPASLMHPVPNAPGPALYPHLPKEKEQMKDYKLNNMFKMIDFLEHDEGLTQNKNGYREKLKEFKKAANLGPSKEAIVKEYNDHERLKLYEIGEDLGKGSFAAVKAAREIASGKKFAVKIYEISKNNTDELKKNLVNEIHVLERLNHPNIMKIHEWFEGKWFTYLVLEFVGSVSLMQYLEQHPAKCISEDEAGHVFWEVAKGLAYMHQERYAHRDIKLDNIMLSSSAEVKIIDFGFSLKYKENQKFSTLCGTPSYMAPEVLSRIPNNPEKADVWSFGICLFRSLVGEFPYRGISQDNLYHMIKKGQFNLPNNLSVESKTLIKSCLSKKPEMRPSFAELMSHDWFQDQKKGGKPATSSFRKLKGE